MGKSKFSMEFKKSVCEYANDHTYANTSAKYGITTRSVTKRDRRNFVMTRSENGQLKAELQQRDERINSLEARLSQLESTSTIISKLKQLLN